MTLWDQCILATYNKDSHELTRTSSHAMRSSIVTAGKYKILDIFFMIVPFVINEGGGFK
jgi:hypothetical protein